MASGLGKPLTRTCLEIAQSWGIERITAVTLPENRHMKSILRRFGFALQLDIDNGLVLASKDLADGIKGPASG